MAKMKKDAELSGSGEELDTAEVEETTEPAKKKVRHPGIKDDKGSKPKKASDGKSDGKEASSRPVRRVTQAPVKKGKATKKRDETVEVSSGRTTPWGFVRQSVAELKKVVWPKGDTVGQYFLVVLIFVLVVMTIVAGLDTFFGWGLMQLLGGK